MFIFKADGQEENDGHTVVSETYPPEAESQMIKSCEHSSDEEEEANEEEEGMVQSDLVASDRRGSRPLLSDSEEEGALCSLHPVKAPTQPSTSFPKPPPSISAQNHFQNAHETGIAADVFSKAPFSVGQEETVDVFANAPFPHAAPPAQQKQPDVFSQTPFGKRVECKISCPHTAEGVLVQMAQQPFRPQALAKYSRHFEGSVPQQTVAEHAVVSKINNLPAVASVPVGPLHSWTSDVGAVDPFISAPFHLKAPQKNP